MGGTQSHIMDPRIVAIKREIEARMYGPDAQTPEAQAWEAAKLKEIDAIKRGSSP